MSNAKVYLCGPIFGCSDAEAKNWRDLLKSKLPNAIDPMARDYRGREAEYYREIVEGDKRDILDADVVLVSYAKPSVGTAMEVFWAWLNHKPVVVVLATKPPPWLLYHADFLLHSYEAALNLIEQEFPDAS